MEELAESYPGSRIKMRGRRGRATRQKAVREKGDGDLGEETDCERIPIKKILVYCNYHKYHSKVFLAKCIIKQLQQLYLPGRAGFLGYKQ